MLRSLTFRIISCSTDTTRYTMFQQRYVMDEIITGIGIGCHPVKQTGVCL